MNGLRIKLWACSGFMCPFFSWAYRHFSIPSLCILIFRVIFALLLLLQHGTTDLTDILKSFMNRELDIKLTLNIFVSQFISSSTSFNCFCILHTFGSVGPFQLLAHVWRNKIVYFALFGICFFEVEAPVCCRFCCNHVSRNVTAEMF